MQQIRHKVRINKLNLESRISEGLSVAVKSYLILGVQDRVEYIKRPVWVVLCKKQVKESLSLG